MKIINKEYTNRITVNCYESERLEVIEKFSEQGFDLEDELQFKSNESVITVYKKVMIKFKEPLGKALSEIDAARFLSKTLTNIKDNEDFKPKLVSSPISDYPVVVSFFSRNIGERILIYIEKIDGFYRAVGYSEEI
ncbi:hypothetical protein H4J45_18085 [Colwellia sp. BRX10-6]|uniref:hypothetical protein n=1 Tax=unclassified Colwellia TaxID=196834 RepID=UPI0015F6A032|nr:MULTISPECIES: hypothetical protein [unclassified Colwellia]MBA6385157.1 hypothetical protein [Colwellia sp. BRX10-9]MBA6395994.1 hypothetical protein [Colwellia sp. BRX10-6]